MYRFYFPRRPLTSHLPCRYNYQGSLFKVLLPTLETLNLYLYDSTKKNHFPHNFSFWCNGRSNHNSSAVLVFPLHQTVIPIWYSNDLSASTSRFNSLSTRDGTTSTRSPILMLFVWRNLHIYFHSLYATFIWLMWTIGSAWWNCMPLFACWSLAGSEYMDWSVMCLKGYQRVLAVCSIRL